MPSVQTQPTELDRRNNTATEYLGRILQRHNDGDSENDIRIAFRDFTLQNGIIDDEGEIKTEVPPANDSIKRVDMYTRNTYIEFKRNLIVNGQIDPNYIAQLDGYLLESVKSGWGIQNGILTDGQHYLKRNIGESILPIARNSPRSFDLATQGPRLREYLYDIISTDAGPIAPSPETLTKHLAGGSDLLNQATALLKDAHDANRDNPTVAVKRKLWQDLLEVALGQDSTGDPDDADWLFIRHTYLTTLIALILQAHFGIDIIHEADHAPDALLNGDTLYAHTNLKGVIESDLFQWPAEIGATHYIRSIARKVAQFDWSKRPDELAAILYQNTITQEERRKMGEYYTPRWLAQTIVQELITDPQNTVAMDPACGSGTFIECLVRNIIDHSHAQHPIETLGRHVILNGAHRHVILNGAQRSEESNTAVKVRGAEIPRYAPKTPNQRHRHRPASRRSATRKSNVGTQLTRSHQRCSIRRPQERHRATHLPRRLAATALRAQRSNPPRPHNSPHHRATARRDRYRRLRHPDVPRPRKRSLRSIAARSGTSRRPRHRS